LLGFGFFGVSVIWSVYNAFVPLILDDRFGLQAGFISFIMEPVAQTSIVGGILSSPSTIN